ncbi:hypothetical protein [Variovorax sp. LT1R16]|uniref:hypothetical protein n=1 Tax=Variovorax sp. LT1R16 TaxID=3443728 RepID=UPI003F46D073
MTSSTAPLTPATDATASATGEQHEARVGDRGAASGRNIAQNRAIGQDDPMEGSRLGREQDKVKGFPGDGEPGSGEGTDAAQTREAND